MVALMNVRAQLSKQILIQRHFKSQKTSKIRNMCSIDDMLTQLRTNRQSIAKQIDVLNEIMSKSNNVLLQMDMERSKETTPEQDVSNMKAYNYEKKSEQSLTRAVELYQNLPLSENDAETFSDQSGFAEYIHHNCQNLNFLNTNVRKLLVIGEIMSMVTDKNENNE